jgi:hypothetical protein
MSGNDASTLASICTAFEDGEYLVRRHFLVRLAERGILLSDVASAIRDDAPEIIENYPNDTRGPSCLISCRTLDGEIYHVQRGMGLKFDWSRSIGPTPSFGRPISGEGALHEVSTMPQG